MDEGSTTIALTARLRKRSISSHRHHSTTDNNGRTSLIKTKIQKIDGQYKASPTCPINNEEEEQKHSSDDQDEPLIVATLPPLIQNSSKYRTRQDIYDDEAGDDQQSNSSSLDDSPTHQSESSLSAQSPMKSTIITIQKPTQSLNETINETSVDILTMPTRRSNRVLSEENIQEKSITIEESVQQRTKLTKRSNVIKSASAITLEENPTIDSTNQTSSSSPLPFTIDETYSTTDDSTNKPTTSVDVHTSNNKPSLNTNDQTKVKVRLKTIPPSSQTNKNTKPVNNTKTTKSVEQKPLKKPSIIQKETVITTKKSTPTVTPKKLVNTSINKPSLNQNNSEKQPVRSSSKPIEKKSSDISDSTTTPKKPIEPTPPKKPPVRLGKIPKLTPTNIQKPTEKPTSSKSLTNQKSDLLAFGGNLNNNKELNTTEKNPPKLRRPSPKRRSPQRPNRPQKNPIDTSDPFLPLPPMDLDITMDKTLGKQPPPISNQRYPSLLDNNPRSTSNFSRSNSIALENTQSQSPLSPGPSSTLYPPPSPPLSRSIPPSTKTLSDSRSSESLVRPNSSSNLIHTQSIPPLSSISNDYNDPWTTNKSSNIWDSASSDEEQEDESSARRFFHQNMRAADEELSKIDDLRTSTPPPPPADSRVEQLLKRQKKASLCLGSNGETFEENSIEPSASVDDFECVAMDIDSPKHRTQSESSDNNQTIVESSNSKSTTNGTAVSKIAELTTASSTNTSKKLTSKNRPLKATSMTLIDELKNSINPSFSSKQSVLSPPSRSLSRSRSRSRTHSRSRSRSRSRTRTRSRSRSRSRSSSSTSSSSSHKRRSRHRSSKRHSAKHHQRRRSASYNNDNELIENNTNNYPSAPPYYQSHHHHHSHPHQQQHWPSARQTSGLLPGPPSQPYGHQPPVPPLLPNHPYYPPPANRSLMHPVEPPGVAGSRFNFQHNPHQRHHPPLMHASYYPQAPPQPLMQSASRSHHHPMNRFPPPPRPFDIPPHPMAMANPGPHPSNSNYNQYKYESDEHVAIRRGKRDTTMSGANTNNNRRGGPQQTESNGKNRMNNPSKSSDHPDMDQLRLKRDQLIAELDEITNSGDIDKDQPSLSHNKRSISNNHSNPAQLTISQDDEGEEGEISESD